MSSKMSSQKLFAYSKMVNRKTGEPDVIERVRVSEEYKKFDFTIHFRPDEDSDYLAETLGELGIPFYGTVKTDDPEYMQYILANGYTRANDSQNIKWVPFFPFWRDQEGHAFVVPEGSGINDLRDIGIYTSLSTPGEVQKVPKYLNRLFVPSQKKILADPRTGRAITIDYPTWGTEIAWIEKVQTAVVLLDQREGEDVSRSDRMISIRYVGLDALDEKAVAVGDGAIIASFRAAKLLNLSNDPQLGLAKRVTMSSPRGFAKGHLSVKDGMEVDLVIYGPKTILKTKRFFFSSMGDLHVGIPATDWQSFINFYYHRPGLADAQAVKVMKEVWYASGDASAMRLLLVKYTKDIKEIQEDTEQWILRRSMQYDVSHMRIPGLHRRAVRYMLLRVMSAAPRARIPLDGIGLYAYVIPDILHGIDSQGDIKLDDAVPEGCIVYPDLPDGTEVVAYRQPSENTNAHVFLTVWGGKEYAAYRGKGLALLGRGAYATLGRLGGGDMDDSLVLIYDKTWVEAFKTLPKYPETEKLTDTLDEEEQMAYDMDVSEEAQLTDDFAEFVRISGATHYTNKHAALQIEMSMSARANIGTVVNYGMFDLLLSDPGHKASMVADLKQLGTDEALEAIDWLYNRPPNSRGEQDFQARLLMTNLEDVIDMSTKDPTHRYKLGDPATIIKRFHQECLVYPTSMASRVPASRQKAALDKPFGRNGGYLVARTLTCRVLERIQANAERLLELLTDREWDLVAPADDALRQDYPFEKELAIRLRGDWRIVPDSDPREFERMDPDVIAIKDIWNDEWRNRDREVESVDQAYKRIINMIREELQYEDADMMERLAVELYYQTYRTYGTERKYDEVSGKLRGYPDALLWSPIFADHFINALRGGWHGNYAKLAGYYKAAELDPKYRRRLMGMREEVLVRNRTVYVRDDQDEFTVPVGFVLGPALEGKFPMESGLIEFRKGKEITQPSPEYQVVVQKPLTRLFPSKFKVVDEVKPVEIQSVPRELRGWRAGLKEVQKILGLDKKGGK